MDEPLRHLENPDFILIDLDPQECPYDMIVDAALMVQASSTRSASRVIQDHRAATACISTFRSRPVYSYEGADLRRVISRIVITEKPELFTTPRSVSKREQGSVYFDYLQIGKSKTIAAPYVLRAYPERRFPRRWNGGK